MPLTSVVHYFNEHLHELHPCAHLSRKARFQYSDGRVSARVAGFRLFPRQAPVVVRATGEVFAWSAKLLAESEDGRRVIPETLYVHAWDGDDCVFLDRFLRTLHALHHLSLGDHRAGLLAVDVHLRHLAALPEQHGRVFETLLHRLGLSPAQIVMRLPGTAVQRDPHVREAALSFAGRGYGLLAARADPADTDWALLQSIGFRWVTLDPAVWQSADRPVAPADWARQARSHGIGLWLEGVDSAAAVAHAANLDADLIEGALWEPAARREAPTRLDHRSDHQSEQRAVEA
jgi:EAL domain-containing protein (putative c-di-GMP-specific phosphodiesterase class I)